MIIRHIKHNKSSSNQRNRKLNTIEIAIRDLFLKEDRVSRSHIAKTSLIRENLLLSANKHHRSRFAIFMHREIAFRDLLLSAIPFFSSSTSIRSQNNQFT